MDKSAIYCLTDSNDGLKKEIWDLRDMAANLDTEKQEILMENKSMKEQNRSLEAKIDCFQAMAEDLQREEEQLQVMLRELEETIAHLESQNHTLRGTNRMLRTNIQAVSAHTLLFQDYKAVQDQDIVQMKHVMEHIVAYFKELEAKIETAEQWYSEERNHTMELGRTLEELDQIREVQENEIFCLREQLVEASLLRSESDEDMEFPSLLHEMVQAKLVQDSLAMQNSIFLILSKVVWLLMAAVVCLGFLNISVKVYVFLFNKDLELGSQSLLFPGHFRLLSEVLYPHRTKKPNGLLPF